MPFLYDLAARALKVSGLVVTACSAPWFGLLLCRGFGGPHAVYLPFSYFPLALLSRRFHSFPSAPGLRGVDVLLISDPTTDAHFLKNCTGPAPRPWSRCEMRDGDCDACRQPLLAGLSPVAKITLSGVPTLVSSAKAAQAVIKGLGNGSDLISFDSPTTGLHTSMFCRDLNTSRFIRNPHLQIPLGAPPGIASSTSANVLCPPPACRPQERSGWLTRSRSLRSPSLPRRLLLPHGRRDCHDAHRLCRAAVVELRRVRQLCASFGVVSLAYICSSAAYHRTAKRAFAVRYASLHAHCCCLVIAIRWSPGRTTPLGATLIPTTTRQFVGLVSLAPPCPSCS